MSGQGLKVLSFVGARPQFVKEALVSKVVRELEPWEHVLVHSGQHYDRGMSGVFFEELGIPEARYNLGIGSGSHGAMTAAALVKLEELLLHERPDCLLTYGDTNTTLAGALAAAKLGIPVAHVEAGLRQEPRSMPEEINRVLTDRLADWRFCCSQKGADNLAQEGIDSGICVCGDVMYDLFMTLEPRFDARQASQNYGLNPGDFILATMHRDFNVDSKSILEIWLRELNSLPRLSGLRLILPLHPRTRKNIESFGLEKFLQGILVTQPLGYIELMSLTRAAALVVTDSGGLQKEAFYAGKRSLLLMPDTCWIELVDCGWNFLCQPEEGALAALLTRALEQPASPPPNPYGNGQAAQAVVATLLKALGR